MSISERDKVIFLKKGQEAEKEFSALFKNAIAATKNEDIKDHVDVKIVYKFDVKGLKKRRRSDAETDETIHWVELKNVQGKLGWLYGDADFFAFELKKYWLIVDKLKLQDFIKETVSKEYVEKPELYKFYRRKDRKDVITLVSSIDLCYICKELIKK